MTKQSVGVLGDSFPSERSLESWHHSDSVMQSNLAFRQLYKVPAALISYSLRGRGQEEQRPHSTDGEGRSNLPALHLGGLEQSP